MTTNNSINLPTGSLNTIVLGQGIGSAFASSTATYLATTTANQILYSSANNVISEIAAAANGVLITSAGSVPSISSTLPVAVQSNITMLGTIASGVWNGSVIGLVYGGTNANLTASNGGIVWSNATQMQILAGSATARQMLQSGSSATPAWSAAIWPSSTTANQILYSSATNTVSEITAAANSVLITSAGNVPSLSATLPNAVQDNITRLGTIASIGASLGVAFGGSGVASHTAYAVICGGTTTTGGVQSIASVGTAGHVLTSNGAGALPTFQSGPASQTGRLQSFQILTSGTAATYTTPAGITSLLVECLGGGGGGGGSVSAGAGTWGAGAGGGAGGYARKFITGAAASYTYTVGANGTGSSVGNNPGGNGTASTFSTISAGGGNGGTGGPSTVAFGSDSTGGAGGTCSGGDVNFSGRAGQNGVVFGATLAIGGQGASSFYGPGVNNVYASTGVSSGGSSASANTGGGGSGGALNALNTTNGGGAGGSGIIIVWEYT